MINGEVLGSGGWIQAEILRESGTGEPVPGFAAADCDLFRGDEVSHVVTWGGRGASELKGSRVALRFRMRNARLYSYSFA